MKWALLFCAAVAVSLPLQIVHAAQSDDDDIVILSVKPRSPDVKPIAAAVTSKGQDLGKTPAAQAGTQVARR
jgi:hypothetical protein